MIPGQKKAGAYTRAPRRGGGCVHGVLGHSARPTACTRSGVQGDRRAAKRLPIPRLPGRCFANPQDFNAQFADWLTWANARTVRTIKAAPIERLAADLAGMLELPPRPLDLGWHQRIRLPRDDDVRVDSSDDSVDPRVIGRLVDVSADLARVRVHCAGHLVAEHRRVFARGQVLTDPAHVEMARVLRRAFRDRPMHVPDDGLTRDLADYDRAFGLAGER